MAAPSLNIDIHEKRFGGAEPLFADFSIGIAPGSVVALLGPSGVGKSTLLRLVAGVDTVYSGEILVDGQPAAQREAPGFVFQDARLLPWLTIAENLRLAAPHLSDAELDHRLDRVGLSGIGGHYPHQLSGGMQRRTGLARAIATQSSLLLLDEPFASLDAALVADMRALLADLVSDADRTVLLVTHDPADAAVLADRAVVLAGRPAKIVRIIDLPIPRSARTASDVEHYRGLLSL